MLPLTCRGFVMTRVKVSYATILSVVKRLRRATSKDVTRELVRMGFRVKWKAVAVMLLRCKRQGLLDRARWGRSGFVYRIVHKGGERLEYLANRPTKSVNLAVSKGIPKPRVQFHELILYFATFMHRFWPLRMQENQNRLNTIISYTNESEIDLSRLWREMEHKDAKEEQYEKVIREVVTTNQELMRIIVDLLASSHTNLDFKLGRSVGRFEAASRARVNTMSLQEKKRTCAHAQKSSAQTAKVTLNDRQTRSKSFPFAFPVPSAQTLKIMRESSTSPPNIGSVEETNRDDDERPDVNHWWLHL